MLAADPIEEHGVIFETFAVPAPFDQYVESVFHFKHFQPDHAIERVVPTGHVFVIFELDGFTRHTYDNTTLKPNADYTKAWVSTIHHEYLSISAHEDSEMLVIQFKAYGARPFLHLNLDEVANRVIPGSEILDGVLLDVREQLFSAGTSADKFAVIQSWLEQRFNPELAPPAAVLNVAHQLQQQPASKLNQILDSTNGTQKHLIAQFRRFIGLTPKQYQRILRFNDVFAKMQGDQFLGWADIADLCGYSDQSHFIREFKNFSGFNPKAFLEQEFDEDTGNFFPLDREG